MPISTDQLKNSLATAAAYATAITEGMEQWRDDKDISQEVTGIEAPTFVKLGPGNGDGMEVCLQHKPQQPPTLTNKQALIDSLRHVAEYLKLLEKNV